LSIIRIRLIAYALLPPSSIRAFPDGRGKTVGQRSLDIKKTAHYIVSLPDS